MKRVPDKKVKRGLTLSKVSLLGLEQKDFSDFLYSYGEFNKNVSINEMSTLKNFKHITEKGALLGLNTEQNGEETLIFGGCDYFVNLIYAKSLSYDSNFASSHLVESEEEDAKFDKYISVEEKNFNEQLINLSKDLKDSNYSYGVLFSSNSIITVLSGIKENKK